MRCRLRRRIENHHAERTERSSVIPSQCAHWRGNPYPLEGTGEREGHTHEGHLAPPLRRTGERAADSRPYGGWRLRKNPFRQRHPHRPSVRTGAHPRPPEGEARHAADTFPRGGGKAALVRNDTRTLVCCVGDGALDVPLSNADADRRAIRESPLRRTGDGRAGGAYPKGHLAPPLRRTGDAPRSAQAEGLSSRTSPQTGVAIRTP